MDLYLAIEKVRFGERLNVLKKVEDPCLELKLPNMILQPLYENAIKYGVYEQLEPVDIQVLSHCESGNLSIKIINNYDGKSSPQRGKGIGLKNVRTRLELIYGIPDLVTIEKDKKYFSVHLLIPQHTAFPEADTGV